MIGFEACRAAALADAEMKVEAVTSAGDMVRENCDNDPPNIQIMKLEGVLDLLFKAGEVRKYAPVLWDCVAQHSAKLLEKWRQYVRPGIFTGRDLGQFELVWNEFVGSVVMPSALSACPEVSGSMLNGAVRRCADAQREFVFSYLESESTASAMAVPTFAEDNDPIGYERECANQLQIDGWHASNTKTTGDQGADVIAEKDGVRIALQCKLYSTAVGNKAVQEIIGARGFYSAQACAVVSNAGFTRAAEDLAAVNGVDLIHHTALVTWAESVRARATGDV